MNKEKTKTLFIEILSLVIWMALLILANLGLQAVLENYSVQLHQFHDLILGSPRSIPLAFAYMFVFGMIFTFIFLAASNLLYNAIESTVSKTTNYTITTAKKGEESNPNETKGA